MTKRHEDYSWILWKDRIERVIVEYGLAPEDGYPYADIKGTFESLHTYIHSVTADGCLAKVEEQICGEIAEHRKAARKLTKRLKEIKKNYELLMQREKERLKIRDMPYP